MARKPKLGTGKRFAAIVKKARKSGARDPEAVAASAGFKAHGKKRMENWAHKAERAHFAKKKKKK